MNSRGLKFLMGLSMDGLMHFLKPHFFDLEKNLPNAGYLRSRSIGEKAGPAVMQAAKELITQQPK